MRFLPAIALVLVAAQVLWMCGRTQGMVRRVVDETGAPVAGATIHRVAEDDTTNGAPTRSRDDGTFDLPDGTGWQIEVTAPQHLRVRARAHPRTDWLSADSRAVTLRQAVVVRGRCIDASGRPLEGVPVQSCEAGAIPTRTGPDGRFRVEKVPRKRGIVTMSADGWATETRRAVPEGLVECDVGDVVVESGR